MSEQIFFEKLDVLAARFEQSLRDNPLDERGLRNLSDIYYWQGRLAEALPFFKTARYTQGAGPRYQLLLGQLYWRLEDTANASKEFEIFETMALATEIFDADNYFYLDGAAWYAEALRWQGDLPRAHALAKTLIKKAVNQPYFPIARLFYPLAGLLRTTGEWALANQLRQAAIMRPDLADRRLMTRQATGLLVDGDDADGLTYLMDVSRGLRLTPPVPPPLPVTDKIHLGLVCQDLRNHPVGHYLRPLLQAYALGHLPGVRIYLYNTGDENPTDPVYGELRATVGNDYRHLRGRNLNQIQAQIFQDHIAVLTDLGGRSPRSHTYIFETRLAPIQAMWLGWGHTIGSAGIDYLIVDKHCAPTDTRYVHEELAVLNAPYMQIPQLPVLPADNRAPCVKNGYVTFGWPNRLDKITPACFDRDAQILRLMPSSKLLVMRPESEFKHEFIKNNVVTEFRKRGIPAARLEFVANTPQNYAETLRRIDIVLDPIAVNGGATSMDAIMHGVLVATQPGTQIYQRFTHGFLHAANLGHWSFSGREFVNAVVQRASDTYGLSRQRDNLLQTLPHSPLMDRALLGRAWVECLQHLVSAQVKKNSESSTV